jgi:hypothetical protein
MRSTSRRFAALRRSDNAALTQEGACLLERDGSRLKFFRIDGDFLPCFTPVVHNANLHLDDGVRRTG